MTIGQVKWFNDAKGYGFINVSGTDYFVHFKEIQCEGFKSLKQGDRVSFTPEKSPKGMIAKTVSIVN